MRLEVSRRIAVNAVIQQNHEVLQKETRVLKLKQKLKSQHQLKKELEQKLNGSTV